MRTSISGKLKLHIDLWKTAGQRLIWTTLVMATATLVFDLIITHLLRLRVTWKLQMELSDSSTPLKPSETDRIGMRDTEDKFSKQPICTDDCC